MWLHWLLLNLAQSLAPDQYHAYDAINDYLTTHPEASIVGETLEGRNIWIVEKMNEQANKTLLIDCGRGARDWVAVSFCLDLIQNEAPLNEPVNLIIVPLANPDGYQYTIDQDRQWQKNRARPVQGQFCQGVDLQRNFPFEWSSTSDNQCSTDYAGVIGASEIETRAMIDLIGEKKIDAVMVVSTGLGLGQTVQYPWRYGSVQTDNHNDVDVVGRKIARDIGLELGNNFTYHLGGEFDATSGTLEDYARNEGIKYVFRVEMRSDNHMLPSTKIQQAVQETRAGLERLVLEVTKPYYPNFRNIFDYIAWDDGVYKWEILDERVDHYEGFDFYTMYLTAQQWLTEYDIRKPIWTHIISIAVPHNFDPEMAGAAYLAIDGGFDQKDMHGIYPDSNYNAWAIGKIARDSGAIAANIYFVPNQRVHFVHDWVEDRRERGRAEDSIIAYTWKYFVHEPNKGPNTDEPHWLLRFPMVKSAVKAMDAITEFNAERQFAPNIENWCITGASKRGWTTWMVGAVDPRVNCLAPMVETFVDMQHILHGHFQALGGWSFAFDDYYNENLTQWLDSPEFGELCRHVDPFSYRQNLTMDKLIIQSAGDEFFLPTDTKYFIDKLPGNNYLRMLPNAEHEMILHGFSSPHLVWTQTTFFMAANKASLKLPQISWERLETENEYGVRIVSDEPLSDEDIKLRVANTADLSRLDFRLVRARYEEDGPPLSEDMEDYYFTGIWWPEQNMTKSDEAGYEWVEMVAKPDETYRGVFALITHQLGINPHTGLAMNFTQTSIFEQFPLGYPNEDCAQETCLGTLV